MALCSARGGWQTMSAILGSIVALRPRNMRHHIWPDPPCRHLCCGSDRAPPSKDSCQAWSGCAETGHPTLPPQLLCCIGVRAGERGEGEQHMWRRSCARNIVAGSLGRIPCMRERTCRHTDVHVCMHARGWPVGSAAVGPAGGCEVRTCMHADTGASTCDGTVVSTCRLRTCRPVAHCDVGSRPGCGNAQADLLRRPILTHEIRALHAWLVEKKSAFMYVHFQVHQPPT